MARHGLTTAQHDKMDVSGYYGRVYARLPDFKGKTIVDLFSGGGRDIADFCHYLGRDGVFVAVDSEAQRLVDMVSKNFETAKRQGVTYEIVASQAAFEQAVLARKIAAIQGRFPDRPLGNNDKVSDIALKADFALCNAGIMFVKPEELAPSLAAMADLLNTKGELVLRFSLARADKQAELGRSYFVHEPAAVQRVLEQKGLSVTRHPDLDDPGGRPFKWVDFHAVKP